MITIENLTDNNGDGDDNAKTEGFKAHFHPFGFAAVCYCLQALLLFSLAI